jgi:hypothetical protein
MPEQRWTWRDNRRILAWLAYALAYVPVRGMCFACLLDGAMPADVAGDGNGAVPNRSATAGAKEIPMGRPLGQEALVIETRGDSALSSKASPPSRSPSMAERRCWAASGPGPPRTLLYFVTLFRNIDTNQLRAAAEGAS